MRVSVECDSPLLQRSLELFLHKHICSYEESDLVIRDRKKKAGLKPMLLIANEEDADLRKPFSKEALLRALEEKLRPARAPVLKMQTPEELCSLGTEADLVLLEAKIEQMTQEYKTNIIKAVRQFYEKK